MQLDLLDLTEWRFANGGWHRSPEGVLTPPGADGEFFQAFYFPETFSDLSVELDMQPGYRDNGHGSAGVILRAQDARHYYLAYIPWGGQQTRAKHFWAAIGRVGETGYIHNLKLEMVHDVPAAPTHSSTRWYHVKVTCTGPEIRMWVDGRPGPSVRDDTFRVGRVGLGGQGEFAFKNARIEGARAAAGGWSDAIPTPRNWTVPAPALSGGQQAHPMAMLPGGTLLLTLYCRGEGRTYLLRSRDKGWTWSEPEPLPFSGPCSIHRRRDGRLILLRCVKGVLEAGRYGIAESSDEGRTWSPLQPCVDQGGWVAQSPPGLKPGAALGPGYGVFETPSGALLRFMAGRHESDSGDTVMDWGRTHCVGYSIRSADGGNTWSPLQPLDGPPSSGLHLDQTEPCAVVTNEDKIMVLIRPISSPWMWKTWSEDDGVSWHPLTTSGIPGYAPMLGRTTSGVLLAVHRYPHTTIHASRDSGLTWDAGTVVDPGAWANPTMLEVEPEVMLLLYPDPAGAYHDRDGACRLQRIRVTPLGLAPIRS